MLYYCVIHSRIELEMIHHPSTELELRVSMYSAVEAFPPRNAPSALRFDLFAFPLYLLYNVLLDTAEATPATVLCKPVIHHGRE